MKLVTVAEMRAIEKEADNQGLTYQQMMENAGLGVANVVLQAYGEGDQKHVTGLVGPGNNGGDTLVALAAMVDAGWQASAYLASSRQENDPLLDRLRQSGGRIFSAGEDKDFDQLVELLENSEVLLDGILGTGAKLPVKGELAVLLQKVLDYHRELQVVAVDCPSGVDCDSGETAPETIPADLTICMAAVKTGLLKFPAFNLVGNIQVVGIGLPDDLPAWQGIRREVVTLEDVRRMLPERKPDAHKGTFGTAMIVAGSLNYTGAVLLAGEAAYRIGAGLVRLAVPGPLHTALAGQLPEATWLLLPHEMGAIAEDGAEVLFHNLDKVTALLVGPGLGMEDTTADFIKRFATTKGSRHNRGSIGFVMQPERAGKKDEPTVLPPLVMDADGLKLLAKVQDWQKMLPAPAVLTPHPGEMAVLTGLSVEEIQADRMKISSQFAKKWGHVVVLKGAVSIIASPDGRIRVVPVATSALARAGTGDVLAGLIVGLRAQGVPAFEAASAAAWIHAQAGLAAAGWLGTNASVLAGDVLAAVPGVLAEVEGAAG